MTGAHGNHVRHYNVQTRLRCSGYGIVRRLRNPAQLRARTSRGIDKRLSFADVKENSSDARLILSVRSGDQQAMGELFDRYSSLVYSVALRVLGDTGAAEDILQEVFMQLWRKPAVFDSARGSLAAWLAVIARNRAIDAIRKRKPETDIEDVIVSVEPDFAGEAERNRAAEHIRRKLSEMPEPQRSALEMAFFEGLTHSEIATKTGTPLGTIKTRIRTALISLRAAVVK